VLGNQPVLNTEHINNIKVESVSKTRFRKRKPFLFLSLRAPMGVLSNPIEEGKI